jgi:acetyl-CoA C-acetyltransferase
MERVAIIGASMTQFGQRDAWLRELLVEAGEAALADANVTGAALDHLYVSNMASGEFEGQTGVANALAHDLAATPAYTARVDQTSASGGAGVYAAWQSVASGVSDCTLLVGGEKMTHRSTAEATDVIASLTHPVEYKHGVTLPSFAGLTARHYLETYDAPRESLGKVAVKNHANGVDNPHAQFRKQVDLETVLESPIVADPLRLYDFCPITDGSAALVCCPVSVADEYVDEDEYVVISGIGGATDTHVVHERADLTTMGGVRDSLRDGRRRPGRRRRRRTPRHVHDPRVPPERRPRLFREGCRLACGRGRRHRAGRRPPDQHLRRPQIEGAPARRERGRTGVRGRQPGARNRGTAPGRRRRRPRV